MPRGRAPDADYANSTIRFSVTRRDGGCGEVGFAAGGPRRRGRPPVRERCHGEVVTHLDPPARCHAFPVLAELLGASKQLGKGSTTVHAPAVAGQWDGVMLASRSGQWLELLAGTAEPVLRALCLPT